MPLYCDVRLRTVRTLPVSYTHLKAVPDKLEGAEEFLQLLNKVKEAVAEMPGKNGKPEASIRPAVRLFSFGSLDPVSYTHLDVYKRQLSSCSKEVQTCT